MTPALLRAAIEGHLALFVLAWGVEVIRPKHHFVLHLPDMLRCFWMLVSTLTNERRHRVVTRYTRPRLNAKTWDLSVVEEITAHQLWELEEGWRWLADRTSTPHPRVVRAMQDILPGESLANMVLRNRVQA